MVLRDDATAASAAMQARAEAQAAAQAGRPVTRARTASSPAPAPQPAPAPPPAPVPPSPWHAALQAIAANIAPAVCAARRVAVVVLAAAGMVAYAKHVGAQAGAASASPAAVMSHVAADLLPVAIILLA